jgi:hypothetical protein
MPEKRTLIRKIIRIFILLGLSGLALFALLSALAMTPPAQRALKSLVEKAVSKNLYGRCSIGSWRTNFLTHIDFYDVRLVDAAGHGDSLYAAHIGVAYSLPPLLNKKVEIKRIIVEKTTAYGVRLRTGKVRWPFWPEKKSSTKKSAWKVMIDSAQIGGISGRYHDTLLSMDIALDEIRGGIRFFRLDSLAADLKSTTGRATLPWWRGAVNRFEASGIVSPRSLVLRSFLLSGDSSRVNGKGLIGFKSAIPWNLNVDVYSHLSPVTVLKKIPLQGKNGTCSAAITLSGTLKEPKLTVRGMARNLTVAHIPLDTLGIRGYYDPKSPLSATFHAASSYGDADIKVGLLIPSLMHHPRFNGYTCNLDAKELHLTALAKSLGVRGKLPAGIAAISGTMKGNRFKELPDTATLAFAIVDSGSANQHPAIDARVRLGKKGWELETELGQENRLTSRGIFEAKGRIDGVFDVDLRNPGAITRYFLSSPLTGRITGNGRVNGAVKRPSLSALVQGTSIGWQGLTVETMRAGLDYENGRFSYTDAGMIASGSLDTILPLFKVQGIGGRFTVTARGAGTIDKPNCAARVVVQDFRKGSFGAKEVQADIGCRTDTFTIDNLIVRKDSATISGGVNAIIGHDLKALAATLRVERPGIRSGTLFISGTMNRDTLDATAETAGFDVGLLTPWLPRPLPVHGSASLKLSLGGTRWNPAGEGMMEFRHKVNTSQVIVYKVNSSLHDSVLDATAELLDGHGRASLKAEANIPLSYRRPWRFGNLARNGARVTLDGSDVPFGGLLGTFSSTIETDGALSVHATVEKNNDDWNLLGNAGVYIDRIADSTRKYRGDSVRVKVLLKGSVSHPSFSVRGNARALTWNERTLQKARMAFTLDDSAIVIDSLYAHMQEGVVELAGTIPLIPVDSLIGTRGCSLCYRIAEVPLAALIPHTASIAVCGGTVSGKGTIGVRHRRPVCDGTLSLKGGKAQILECEPALGPIDADLAFSGDSVAVQSIRGWIGGGGLLSGNGYFHLSFNKDARLMLAASEFRTQCGDLDLGVQHVALKLSDSADTYVLSGTIDLSESRYSTYISPAVMLDKLQGVPSRAPGKPNPLLDRIALHLTVNIDRNLTLETNLGGATIDGAVSIVGTAAHPGIVGLASVAEGYVYYLDRRFTVDQGSFRFLDPYVLNPQIALSASTVVTSMTVNAKAPESGSETTDDTVTLEVKGALREPEVSLTSKPYLPPEQIISLLTLGTVQGNFGGDITNRIKEILALQAFGAGKRKLEQTLNIESINLDVAGLDDYSFSIVKRLTPRLSVSYQSSIGKLNQPKVAATYRLLPFFYLIGTGDYSTVQTTGNGGSTSGSGGYDLHLRYSR